MDNRSIKILALIRENPLISSKEINDLLTINIGYATTKRILSKLIDQKLISTEGQGRATKYIISPTYQLFFPIDSNAYFMDEIDERKIIGQFNFSLISNVLSSVTLFTGSELEVLHKLQKQYVKNISVLSSLEYAKELERLAIDLSWKSSQIEGNTYSLLETERLIKEKITASGKVKDEAVMLLNHKEALDFIIQDSSYINPLSISRIEDIHRILVYDLGINKNIRTRRVGISGTNYKPIDNEFQIKEALEQMCDLINKKDCVFEKALLALLLLSYIQPFSDGNKRTARIISNAILINNNHCPISFRTVDSIVYKKAMLLFYEQNNINDFKTIFINQFEFAVNTYF